MAKFVVSRTFEIPERQTLVLAGAILEGQIRAGMFVRLAAKRARHRDLLIDYIDSDFHSGAEEIQLSIWAGPSAAHVLLGLEVAGRTFEVAEHAR